jgi:Predicted outer membrane protein
MAHKKKKPDRIMAGMLAILTAFSPVVSVIPTYAASDNEMSTSVTIDNDTDSGDGSGGSDGSGTSGVVIDDSVQDPGTGQTDISITDDAGDGVVSEVIGDSSSEIQIEDEDDGISIENGQDSGVILVDPSTLSGNDIQVEDTGESISVDQITKENATRRVLRFDFVGENGLVKITPNSDLAIYNTRYIRVHENAEGDKIASIYDDNKQLLYTSEVSNYTAFYQDSVPEGDSFTVEAIADYGYSVATYSILMDSGDEEQEDVFDQTGFVADHYQKYTWDVTMDSDKYMRIAFTDSEDLDLEYENSIGLVDAKTMIDGNIQNTVSGNSVSEDGTDGQGSIILSEDPTEEGFETISSMADEVELPEITKKEEQQASADPIYEGYIRDNLNLDIVGKCDYLGPVSTMRVKQSLYDSNALFGRSDIDDLMEDPDYTNYFVTQLETIVPMYAVNDDTEYLVAYVNTMQQDSRARVIDWDFAEHNFDGILLDGCIYDKDTGLAYIPRRHTMEGEDYYLDTTQIQLAQAINFNINYTESVAMAGSSESDVTVDACSMFGGYPTFDVGAGMDESTLEVYMNGLPITSDFYQYDPSTGTLMVNHSPGIVSSVYVKGGQPKSILGSFLSNLFGLRTVKALGSWKEMRSLGTATMKSGLDDLKPGNLLSGRGTYAYGNFGNLAAAGIQVTNDESKYYCYITNNMTVNETDARNIANWIIGGSGNCPVGAGQVRLLRNTDAEINFYLDVNSITSTEGKFNFKELDVDSDSYIPMRCSHIGSPLGTTGIWLPPNYNITHGSGPVKMRVVEKGKDGGKDYIIIALMTAETGTQTGVGFFRVDLETAGLELRVNKNTGSNSQGLCKDHPRYDLKGAVFGVYRTKPAAENANIIDSSEDPGRDNMVLGSVNCKNYWQGKGELLGTLKSKNDKGLTGVMELDRCYTEDGKRIDDFKDGLYIRELKAPLGYDLDFNVYHVDLPKKLKGDEDTITVPIVDRPLTDPGALTMVKVPQDMLDKGMSKADLMKAMMTNTEDMNGAEFILRFYKSYPNPKLVLNKENAAFECRVKTATVQGIHGMMKLSDPNCYVSGSKWPWVNSKDQPVMPMGIYTLEEVKAPPGYPLERNKMKIIANCFQRDVTDADGKKHFEAHFNWNIDKYPGNSSDERWVPLKDNEFGVAFAWNEPQNYANVGIYKTDENKDHFKTGNKTFKGITFGLIYGKENERPGHNYKGDEFEPGHEVPGVKLEFKDDEIYTTTEHLNKGQGVVSSGIYYFIETKGNGTYLKSEEQLKIVVPEGGKKGTVYFPGKDGNGVPKEEAFDNTGKPTDAIEPFENVSPPMGVELDKTTWTNFGEMKTDDYILGDMTYKDYIFGKQDIGDATLEGHTFAIFHTSDNDIELKDGTLVKSAKNKLEDPENPTWKELNDLYELTDGKIQENGYICDIIVTDAKGEAKTDPDAFSIGTYFVIEVATKEDYVVNNVDVGRVGGDAGVKADDLTPDGGLIKAVFKHNGEIADDGACWNPPVSGGAHIQKLDEMRDDDREHGDTDLSATFKIINASKKAVKNKYGETIPTCGLTDKPDFPTYDQVRAASETCTVYEITADKNGKADTGEHDLIYGTYYVIETEVPDGYHLNTEWVGKIVIREDGKIVPVCKSNNDLHDEYNHYYYDRVQKEPVVHPDDAVACRDQIYRGGVAVQKIDKEMGWQTAQGMGTLKGAEFTILNASGSSARNIDGKDVKSVTSRKDFQETYQQLWRIANETDSPYVMQRIYTNKEGFACTDKFDLPYGTYYIIETKAPLGYWLDEEFVGKITIRDDGRCMMISDSDLPTENGSDFYDINDRASNKKNTVDDQVRRCDLYFRKVDIDGNPKANIPFLLSAIRRDGGGQETILESHVIVSDENGVVTTSSEDITVQIGSSRVTYPGRAHSNNTNGMDKFVQNKIVNPLGEAHLKNGDAARWGVWFQGNGTDYPKNSINESYGALYPGYYRITELQCEDNKDLEENLVDSQIIYIDNDTGDLSDLMSKSDPKNHKLVTHHPLVDTEILIESLALDVESGSKTAPVRDSVEVSDRIRLEHVSADHKYRWATQFRDLSDGGKVVKILGTSTEDATVSDDGLWVEREFYPRQKSGTNNTFEDETVKAFINTSNLRGHTIQAYDYIYQWIDVTGKDQVIGDWVLVKIHPKPDEIVSAQQIYVPDLKTTAKDKYSEDRVGSRRSDDVILDTVQYSGLSTGVVYGIFMDVVDAETGKSLTGKEVGIDTRTGIIGRQNGEVNSPFSDTVNMKPMKNQAGLFSFT